MFKNKVCVITGGAHGIGKAIKEEFLKQKDKRGRTRLLLYNQLPLYQKAFCEEIWHITDPIQYSAKN